MINRLSIFNIEFETRSMTVPGTVEVRWHQTETSFQIDDWDLLENYWKGAEVPVSVVLQIEEHIGDALETLVELERAKP